MKKRDRFDDQRESPVDKLSANGAANARSIVTNHQSPITSHYSPVTGIDRRAIVPQLSGDSWIKSSRISFVSEAVIS